MKLIIMDAVDFPDYGNPDVYRAVVNPEHVRFAVPKFYSEMPYVELVFDGNKSLFVSGELEFVLAALRGAPSPNKWGSE